MKNYYQILEVSENASYEVIEKAYRVLAKKYHPDIQPRDKLYWAETKFKEITEAYNIISNPESRKIYDMKIGLNTSTDKKYNDLYNENEKLKKEINDMKTNNESQNYNNNKRNTVKTETVSYVRECINSIKNMITNEKNKPAEERSKDLKALILTIIIVSIIIFIFWKVPFLNNLIFP